MSSPKNQPLFEGCPTHQLYDKVVELLKSKGADIIKSSFELTKRGKNDDGVSMETCIINLKLNWFNNLSPVKTTSDGEDA